MQIRGRLTIQFTALVTTILISSFSSLYLIRRQSNYSEFQKRLHDKALTSAILLLKVDQVDSTLLKTIDLSKKDVLYLENISIFDFNRKELYTNNDSLEFTISDRLFNQILNNETIYLTENGFDIVGLPFPSRGDKYVIIAGAIDAEGSIRLASLRKLLLILFIFSVAVTGLVGWFFAGRALKPIVQVIDEVQKISPVELSRRLSDKGKRDEIGRLISIFNKLLDRIENAFNLQKSFVSNISHELNNPLTKITSQLEVTLLNERNTDEYKKTIQSVLDDIKELNHLSVSLLELAYIYQDNRRILMESVRTDEVLWEIRDTLVGLNNSYVVQIHIVQMPENETDLCINGNTQLIKTAFKNLIENACKFSPDQSAIVYLSCSESFIEVKIIDHGPGIEESEIKNIFQPFYRVDSTSKIRGHGVGLSLTEKIISIHGGRISIKSDLKLGTEVTISLPKTG